MSALLDYFFMRINTSNYSMQTLVGFSNWFSSIRFPLLFLRYVNGEFNICVFPMSHFLFDTYLFVRNISKPHIWKRMCVNK